MRAKLVPLAILMSTTMCGGLFAAQAQAETIRPQGNWAVSKVAAKQPGAMPYCALARRFGNGSVLTFARNRADETSLAVDLPNSALSPSKSYTITFDPGAGESRSYDAQPVSERGIVIRMGRDDQFYNALEKTGQLAINVGSQSYVFAMPDVKTGTQDLAACLGAQVEPAAGDAPLEARMSDDLNENLLAAEESVIAPATKIPTPVKNVKAPKAVAVKAAPNALTPEPVRETVQNMAAAPIAVDNGVLQNLQEENIRLKNALERERRVYEDKMQQSANASAAAELSEKLRLLEIENGTLRGQVAAAGAVAAAPVAASCTPDQKNQAEIATLTDENNRLKSELESRQKQIVALETAQQATSSSVSKADGNVAALEKRAGDAELQLAGLRDQIARLQAENTSLKNNVSATKVSAAAPDDLKGNVATISKLKALEVQLGDVQAERDRLSRELASIKNADADGRIKISSDNWNLEQATRRFNEAEMEIRRLGSTLEQERAKCAVEKKDLEYMLFDPKIAEKQQIAKLISLEEDLAQANQALKNAEGGDKAKLAAFETRVKELESRVAAENDRVAQAEGRASTLEQRLVATEQEMAGLRQNLAATERNGVTLAEQAEAAQRMQQEIAALNGRIATLQAENAAQKNQAGTEQVAMVQALKQEIASLNGQVANLQSEKTGIAEKLAQISTSAGGHQASQVAGRISAGPGTASAAPVEIAHSDYNAVTVGNPVPVTAQALAKPAPIHAAAPALAAAAAPVNPKMMKQSDVETILQRAGIAVSGKIQPIALSGEAGRVAYRWETNGLFGTMEQKAIQAPAQFDKFVSEYLNTTKSRCTGQFASVPAMDEKSGAGRMAAYEIACVDDAGTGASAALVFESQNGIFTTFAHESSPESMDVAMDTRDKIVSVIQTGKTASR